MQSVIVILGIVSLVGLGHPQSAEKPDAGTTAVLKVSGMSCSACAARVEKEAKKIEGVKSAKASQPKGEAEIRYDPAKTSAEKIARILEEKTDFKVAPRRKPDPPK